MAAQPLCNSSGSANAASVVQQVRLKSHRLRPRDLGVVVRLLRDIPNYGRKGTIFAPAWPPPYRAPIGANSHLPDAIFRIERGRMRYEWFPYQKAEYMTALRFRQLGLTRDDIGERDPIFGTAEAVVEDEAQEPEVAPVVVAVTSVKPPEFPPSLFAA